MVNGQEYMGDWGNLMLHRNAATLVIRKLYTPDSMAQTAESRFIYGWFCRFDIYASMMAGHFAQLDRLWSSRNRDYQQLEATYNPQNILDVIEAAVASLRDLAMDATALVARRVENGGKPDPEIESRSVLLRKQYAKWWADLDPVILHGAEEVPRPVGSSEEDEPFLPSKIYTGPRSAVNYLLLDYYGLKVLMNFQLPVTCEVEAIPTEHENPHDSGFLSIKCCQIIAALQSVGSEPYVLLPTQAQLALVALWLPPVPHYRTWLKKQLAKVEDLGYVLHII